MASYIKKYLKINHFLNTLLFIYMISNDVIKYLCCLNILVYEYDKRFKLNKNETLSKFLINDDFNELSKESKQALLFLKKDSLLGTVYFYLNDEDSDLQVGITVNDELKRITVIFRGTDSARDWYYNLNYCQVDIGDGNLVHKGFYRKLMNNNSFNHINNILFSLLHFKKNYDLNITGHSLGGALATLYAFLIKDKVKTNTKINVVSFGSPRLGNFKFRQSFDECNKLSHYRVTNCRDIVTAVPFYNYSHVGINLYIDSDKLTIYDKYNYNLWFTFSLFTCWNIFDHDIISYYRNIMKNFQ